MNSTDKLKILVRHILTDSLIKSGQVTVIENKGDNGVLIRAEGIQQCNVEINITNPIYSEVITEAMVMKMGICNGLFNRNKDRIFDIPDVGYDKNVESIAFTPSDKKSNQDVVFSLISYLDGEKEYNIDYNCYIELNKCRNNRFMFITIDKDIYSFIYSNSDSPKSMTKNGVTITVEEYVNMINTLASKDEKLNRWLSHIIEANLRNSTYKKKACCIVPYGDPKYKDCENCRNDVCKQLKVEEKENKNENYRKE